MSGYFTPGLPVVTVPLPSGLTIPCDTGASAGAGAESAYVTPTLLGTIGLGDIQAGSGTTTITCDCSTGSHFSITLTTTGHTLTLSNPSNGQEVEIEIVQGGSGSCTITTYTDGTWPTNGTTPTLTTTAGKIDVVKATYNETAGKWRYATKGLNYA